MTRGKGPAAARGQEQEHGQDDEADAAQGQGRDPLPQKRPQGFLVRLDFQHHDDEQEQHHDGPGVNDHFQHRQEGRPQEIEQESRGDKRQHQVNNGVHQVAAGDGQSGGDDHDGPQPVKHDGVDAHGMVLVTVSRLVKKLHYPCRWGGRPWPPGGGGHGGPPHRVISLENEASRDFKKMRPFTAFRVTKNRFFSRSGPSPASPQGRLPRIFTGLASPIWVPLPPTISTPAWR